MVNPIQLGWRLFGSVIVVMVLVFGAAGYIAHAASAQAQHASETVRSLPTS